LQGRLAVQEWAKAAERTPSFPVLLRRHESMLLTVPVAGLGEADDVVL
jgi:hypothetical protein